MKKSKFNPTLNSILALIYMRTQLELNIEYDNHGNIKKHTLTKIALRIYVQITALERTIYSKNKDLYTLASKIAKNAYPKAKDALPKEYSIYIEPLVYGLYLSKEKELRQINLLPTLFNDLFDGYVYKHECKLELESVKPIDIIWEKTEKEIFEYKKLKKRGEHYGQY